jgi:hypothetical protein
VPEVEFVKRHLHYGVGDRLQVQPNVASLLCNTLGVARMAGPFPEPGMPVWPSANELLAMSKTDLRAVLSAHGVEAPGQRATRADLMARIEEHRPA